uniref:Otopetrin n=1 Tax=Caenorhabditis tropicalis TaxID=1561998 RepID=A0A1I7THE1_9PELO
MIVEFSPTFRSTEFWFSYSIFGCYNLSVSILFYAIVGFTSWKKRTSQDSDVVGIGATVFFLRLGALFFCTGAIVLWSTEFFLSFAENQRPWLCILRTCLYITFHASQLVFIVRSNQIKFHCHRLIVYFGLAHGIAVNLWVWMSLCIAKSNIGKNGPLDYNVTYDANDWVLQSLEASDAVPLVFEKYGYELRSVKLFGSTAITFLTGNVEFCLVSAQVLLGLIYTTAWNKRHIGHHNAQYIRFNYKGTEIGNALSYILLVLFILSIVFGRILRNSNHPEVAGNLNGVFELSYYSISIIACIIVFKCLFDHIVRNQAYRTPENRDAMPHEKTLNAIFLLIGASGEVIYCFMGLLGVIRGDTLSDSKGLVLATFIVRAREVIIQALLLMYLLKKGSSIEPCDTFGKQSITFLIALNLILFGFHTFEGSIRSFGLPSKIDPTSKVFLKISAPLVVFFRFHCSVCFAEIWKIAFHDSGTSSEGSEASIAVYDDTPGVTGTSTLSSNAPDTVIDSSSTVILIPEQVDVDHGYSDFRDVLQIPL